ncbi:MAG: YciI family protein [Actinomycetota bacterium]|nr:YciI family protein [Actinomycetota bacterium]MDQ6948921.1 YciI family protein [Actinomycetota bacterium]
MDFLFVIWEGEGAATSEERRQEATNLMAAYVFDLLDQGKLKGGAPLFPASQAVTVRATEGKVTVADGPYIETKDAIGGYFVVEADSMEEATEWAQACPAARYGGVEIRGIMPMV